MVKTLCLTLLLPAMLLGGIPDLRRPVTDPDGLLSAADTEAVADRLVRLRSETGVQMAVLILGSTGGVPIDDYAIQAAEKWKGGDKGKDNGVLLVVAVKDRRMRLEVGYGVEEYLPDGTVRRLLDAQGPLMRARNYPGALLAIVEGVGARLPGNVAGSAEEAPGLPNAEQDTGGAATSVPPASTQEVLAGKTPLSPVRDARAEPAPELPDLERDAVEVPVPERSNAGRNAFAWMALSAVAAVLLMAASRGAENEPVGSSVMRMVRGALYLAPPFVITLLIPVSGVAVFLGYAGLFVAGFIGVRAWQEGPDTGARPMGAIFLGGVVVGIGFALVKGDPASLTSFLDMAFLFSLLAIVPVSAVVFIIAAATAQPSSGDLFSDAGVSRWDDDDDDDRKRRRGYGRSRSSSSSSFGGSSSSSSSRSSSSSGSSWGGGGGSFGGGGASSSW